MIVSNTGLSFRYSDFSIFNARKRSFKKNQIRIPFRDRTTINAENEDQRKKKKRERYRLRNLWRIVISLPLGNFLCRRFCRDRYLIIFFGLISFRVVGNSFLFLDRRLMVSCFFSVMNFRLSTQGLLCAYPVSFRIRGRSWL